MVSWLLVNSYWLGVIGSGFHHVIVNEAEGGLLRSFYLTSSSRLLLTVQVRPTGR